MGHEKPPDNNNPPPAQETPQSSGGAGQNPVSEPQGGGEAAGQEGMQQNPSSRPVQSSPLDNVAMHDLQDLIQQLPWANITFNLGGQYTFNEKAEGAFGPQAKFNAEIDSKYIAKDSGAAPQQTAIDASFSSIAAVESWFFGLNEGDKLAFDKQIHLLVVALFAGNSARFIDEIKTSVKRTVLDEFEEESDDEDEDKEKSSSKKQRFSGASPFQSKNREILKATGTQRSQFTYTENSVPMRVEVLEFVDNRVQPHILEFLRKSPDLGVFRDILQKYLFRICNASDQELREMGVGQVILTRSQAGLGLGELAKNDYTYYLNTFIKPLTGLVVAEKFVKAVSKLTNQGNKEDENPVLPTILGWIFHRLASDSTHRDAVFIQLNQWIDDPDIDYQIVAASSCLALGFVDIDRTMGLIKKAMTKHPWVLQAVYDSVEVLYQVASGASKILYYFAKWQRLPKDKPGNQEAAENALIFFLTFVRKSMQSNQQNNNNLYDIQGQNIQSSSLHTIRAIVNNKADGSVTTEIDVIDLINACIVHRKASVVNAMCDVLEHWIVQADKQTELQDTIISIICQLNDGSARRHIQRIVNSTKLRNSHTTQLIRNRCR